MDASRLGEFEEFVLIAVGALSDKAYSVSIQEILTTRLDRKVSMGALHSALDRLTKKGFIKVLTPKKEKGINGRPRRFFSITQAGIKIMHEVKNKRDKLRSDIQESLPRKKHLPSPANAAIAETVKRIMPSMPSAELELIFPILKRQVVKKHKFLLNEGDVYPNVYFIISGYLRMFYVDGDGHEINYKFIEQHHFITDFQSFLTRKPSRYFCQALTDTELFVLSHQHIHKLYAQSPYWNNFGRLIGEGAFLQLNERVEMYLFLTPEERYLHLLNTRPQLFSQISLSKLATYIGITAESLSRLRQRLRKK